MSKNIDSEISSKTIKLKETLKKYINDGLLTEYLKAVFDIISIANKYVNTTEPWKLIKTDLQKFNDVISELIKVIIDISIFLYPFIPESAKKALSFVGISEINENVLNTIYEGLPLEKPTPIFNKIDNKKVNNG